MKTEAGRALGQVSGKSCQHFHTVRDSEHCVPGARALVSFEKKRKLTPGPRLGGALWVVWYFGVTPAGSGLSAGPTCPGGLLFPLPDRASAGQGTHAVCCPTPWHPAAPVSRLSWAPWGHHLMFFRNLGVLLAAFVASCITQTVAPPSLPRRLTSWANRNAAASVKPL